MDAETKEYIDQKFAQLVESIVRGLRANDAEHRRLNGRLTSIKEVVGALDLDQKTERQRIDRLDDEVFGQRS